MLFRSQVSSPRSSPRYIESPTWRPAPPLFVQSSHDPARPPCGAVARRCPLPTRPRAPVGGARWWREAPRRCAPASRASIRAGVAHVRLRRRWFRRPRRRLGLLTTTSCSSSCGSTYVTTTRQLRPPRRHLLFRLHPSSVSPSRTTSSSGQPTRR